MTTNRAALVGALKIGALTTLLIAGALTPVHSLVVSAGDVGCNPQRPADSSVVWRNDGWQVPTFSNVNYTEYPMNQFHVGTPGSGPTGPTIGGVYSDITSYANYSDNAPNNFDWQWVMLDNDIAGSTQSGSEWAQIGPMTGAAAWGPLGYTYTLNPSGPNQTNDSIVMIEYSSGSTQYSYAPVLNGAYLAPPPGQVETYTVLYNYYGTDEISMWVQQGKSRVQAANLGNLGWKPAQAIVEGETHNNADQMYGDTQNPESFTNTFIYETLNNIAAWYAMDYSDQATIWDYGSSTANGGNYFADPQFGWSWNVPNTPQDLSIFDYACPPHMMTYTAGSGTYPGLYIETTSGPSPQLIDWVYPGTSPSIAQLSDGSYAIAFQGTTGTLCVYTSANGNTNCTNLGISSSTSSPAISALPSNQFVVAFRDNIGQLYIFTGNESGGGSNQPTGQDIMSNTNPAIAGTSNGGWVSSYQAPSGYLSLYYNGTPYNEGLGMDSFTSPAMTSTASGGWQLMFQANVHTLFWLDPTSQPCGSNVCNTNQGMNVSSSPSVTELSNGTLAAAFQNNTSSYDLNTWSSSNIGVSTNTEQQMWPNSSPAIVGTPQDGEWVAFMANNSALCDWSYQNGTWQTGQGMWGGSNPAIAN